MLSGYRTEEGLWRIHMKKNVQNINTDKFLVKHPSPKEAISQIFKLPSTEKTITYYHVVAGFLTNEKCTYTI